MILFLLFALSVVSSQAISICTVMTRNITVALGLVQQLSQLFSCKFRVPEWWRNLSLFTILDLHGVPDNLDQKAQYIDDFVNKLLAIHSDKMLKETPCDYICEKCGTLMIKEMPTEQEHTVLSVRIVVG